MSLMEWARANHPDRIVQQGMLALRVTADMSGTGDPRTRPVEGLSVWLAESGQRAMFHGAGELYGFTAPRTTAAQVRVHIRDARGRYLPRARVVALNDRSGVRRRLVDGGNTGVGGERASGLPGYQRAAGPGAASGAGGHRGMGRRA